MCAFTCSPDQQLTTFCLTHLFAGLYITRTLATTDEFSKTWQRPPSGSRCAVCRSDTSPPLLPENAPGPTSFEPAPLLPFRPTTPGPPAGKRSRRSFGSGKASSGTRMRPYRRTPGPRAPPAPGRRSSCIEMYAPIQDPEAATDARGRAGVRVLEPFPLVPCGGRRANLPNHRREASFVAPG